MNDKQTTTGEVLLEVEDLHLSFATEQGKVRVVEGVSFRVAPGEAVCLVGESGCGKTVSALSLLRLLPENTATIEAGRIRFRGQDLLALSDEEMRSIRGGSISMVFQEPMTSLNPVFTIGHQIEEVLAAHNGMPPGARRQRVIQLLEDVGIPSPVDRLEDYPHNLSGGQRQRVMIAMALACDPDLVIADEPTTALDVTIQAQILQLFKDLQRRRQMALLLITHDLSVVAGIAERVYVMYAGVIVEEGSTRQIFARPRHPYTMGLLASLPGRRRKGEELYTIPGSVPDPENRPPGCPFHPRCDRARTDCERSFPDLYDFGGGRRARCPVTWEIRGREDGK